MFIPCVLLISLSIVCSLDNKSHGRASMSSDLKVAPESDTDSMAEYGEGDTGMIYKRINYDLIICHHSTLHNFIIAFSLI